MGNNLSDFGKAQELSDGVLTYEHMFYIITGNHGTLGPPADPLSDDARGWTASLRVERAAPRCPGAARGSRRTDGRGCPSRVGGGGAGAAQKYGSVKGALGYPFPARKNRHCADLPGLHQPADRQPHRVIP